VSKESKAVAKAIAAAEATMKGLGGAQGHTVDAQKALNKTANESRKLFKGLAEDSGKLAKNIKETTSFILKWTGIGTGAGVILGVILKAVFN